MPVKAVTRTNTSHFFTFYRHLDLHRLKEQVHRALHRTSITKVAAMLGLVPMMTLIFAYFYLNEVPELRQVLGIIPVLAGGYLITKPVEG